MYRFWKYVAVVATVLPLAMPGHAADKVTSPSNFEILVATVGQGEETYSDAQWKEMLSIEQYQVLRKGETEPAGSGRLLNNQDDGTYNCAGCGNPVFDSRDKFDARTGWPSFTRPIRTTAIEQMADTSTAALNTRVNCARCDGHLGHVYGDGPAPTGLRYSINSVALIFVPEDRPNNYETAIFGAGCFWTTEAVFEKIDGVASVKTGYSGGITANPTYARVSAGNSGHAEVVKIEYDPAFVSYKELIATFWKMHDPTTTNRQGADIGPQYRSVIFHLNDEQKQLAEKTKTLLENSNRYEAPIATEIWPAAPFFEAEAEHQDYQKRNGASGYCGIVIVPKLRKLGLLPTPDQPESVQ